jgi:hypothetical protein
MGEKIDQVEILKQQRAALARPLGLVWVREGSSIRGGVEDVPGRRISVIVILSVRHCEERVRTVAVIAGKTKRYDRIDIEQGWWMQVKLIWNYGNGGGN